MSLLAMTPQEKCYNQMAFNWGVIPILEKECRTLPEAFNKASTYALERGFVEYGDLVVVTAGSPFGISGTTNMMIVESIGEVLVRGTSGLGSKVHGNVMLLLQPEVTKFYTARGQILVISRCDEQFAPHIRECVGVILQNDINDNESVTHMIEIANRYGKPFILRADGAMRILKGGQLVTLDPEKALVYKGVVL